VPLIAWIVQSKGPLSRAQIERAFDDILETVPQAHVHIPRADRSYAVEVGLRNMLERYMIEETGDGYAVRASHADAVAFYANSVRHLMDPDYVIPEGDDP